MSSCKQVLIFRTHAVETSLFIESRKPSKGTTLKENGGSDKRNSAERVKIFSKHLI